MEFCVQDPSTYPHRQVHLDFHTQPDLKEIGCRFSKEDFQRALQEGNVDSITVFAKCYHGFCYYPTIEGVQHPGLSFDLTGAMIDAAHEIGVRAPVYMNAGLSHLDAQEHPEWCARQKNGEISVGSYVAEEPQLLWPNMCLNDGSYCRHLYAFVEEICQRYEDLDGLFLDICFKGGPCFCKECRTGMQELGLDPQKDEDAAEYYRLKHISFQKKCNMILRQYHPNATIFFNSGGADRNQPEYHPFSTHFEIEDLPTVWGGYDKMPLNATFFSTTGKFFLGMTGKFHLEWGEFGGFKCKEALKYEVSTMAVYGAGCSIGDHLIWDGKMDMETYRNIGFAYRYLEQIEPYCYGGSSTAVIGVYLSPNEEDNQGISMILLENQIDFEVIREDNFARFDTIIFPGGITLKETALIKLEDYIKNGGKVLFAGDSLIQNGKFQIDCGLEALENMNKVGDYISIFKECDGKLPQSPFYSYLSGIYTKNIDAECFAELWPPYSDHACLPFGRGENLPYDRTGKRYPALVRKGNIVYMAHRIPAIYGLYGSLFHKRYFMFALQLLHFKGPLEIKLGAQGRCRMIHQLQNHRYCINMTYAAPVKRGKAEVIEDITPIYHIPISVTVPEKIVSIELPLKGERLPFQYHNHCCIFTLENLHCHETVVLEYKMGE